MSPARGSPFTYTMEWPCAASTMTRSPRLTTVVKKYPPRNAGCSNQPLVLAVTRSQILLVLGVSGAVNLSPAEGACQAPLITRDWIGSGLNAERPNRVKERSANPE